MSSGGYPITIPVVFPTSLLENIQEELDHADREPRSFVIRNGHVEATGLPHGDEKVMSFNIRLNLHEASKDAIQNWVEQVLVDRICCGLGLTTLQYMDARVTEWPVSSMAGWHTDSSPGSGVSALLITSLTEGWRAGDGGVTEFRSTASPGIRRAFAPQFNRGLALAVSPAAEHRVTPIRRCEGSPRRTLTVALT